MVAHPWVLRCPNGHTSIRQYRTSDETECRACGFRWEGKPFDAREIAEFPIDESEYQVIER